MKLGWNKINWRGRQYYAGLIQGLGFGFLLTLWLFNEKLGLDPSYRLIFLYGTLAVIFIGNIVHGSKKKKDNAN